MKKLLLLIIFMLALASIALAATPILLDVYITPIDPEPDEFVTVTAVIRDDNLAWVKVYYSFDGGAHFNSEMMHPQNDYWSAQIHPIDKKSEVTYYIKAQDEDGNDLKSASYSFWFGGEQPKQEVFINYEEPIKYYRGAGGVYIAQKTYTYRNAPDYGSSDNLYYTQRHPSGAFYDGGDGTDISIYRNVNSNINVNVGSNPGYRDYFRIHGNYPGYFPKQGYHSYYYTPYPTPYFGGYYAYYWPRIKYKTGYTYYAHGSYWAD